MHSPGFSLTSLQADPAHALGRDLGRRADANVEQLAVGRPLLFPHPTVDDDVAGVKDVGDFVPTDLKRGDKRVREARLRRERNLQVDPP